MEGTSIIAMSGGFIALAIMLSIGTLILGGSVTDCSGLQGSPQSNLAAGVDGLVVGTDVAQDANIKSNYKTAGNEKGTNQAFGTTGSWGYQCAVSAEQARAGYGLLMVTLIVLAAAVVLLVVRLLAGQ